MLRRAPSDTDFLQLLTAAGSGGAAKVVGRVILSGLLTQVGAVYRAHEPDRDSSLESTIGRRDLGT